jgi:hypothetical protein
MCRRTISRLLRLTHDFINSSRPLRGHVAAALWVAPFIAVFSGGAAMAAPTVLDFEDLPPGTTVTAQYGPRGVLFQQAYVAADPGAHSGTRVLWTTDPAIEIFTPVPLVMTFTSAQARVKLFAGSPGAAINGTLTAFDANGAVVASDGPKLVAQDVFTTPFEVTVATASITRAELQLEGSHSQPIDDLEFEGEPPGQVPTTPPVVQILSPASGVDRDLSQIDVTGTVTGDGLLSPVTMTMSSLRPPEQSTAPPFTSVIGLTGSGTTRSFSLPIFGNAPLGPITITVTAENTGALKGTGTSTFTNLPDAIRSRFIADGGAATYGALRFGLFLNGCKVAVYEQGAISTDGSTATRVIRGQIFTKWLSLKGPFNSETGYFGCPLGEERDTAVIGGARVQDFERGRIYGSLLIGLESRTAYVPAVFVDALEKRGGELVNGLPLADPSDSIGPSQTWLFQRFFRPDRTDQLPSTLEIRGTPPTLWMERQGGDWFLSALEPSDFDKSRNKSAATLWESFSCTGNLGPCTVDPEPPFPPPNTPNAGDLFCNGITYIPTLEGTQPPGVPAAIPPEWVGIRGDYVVTPVFGAIVSAYMDNIDNGFTHETHNGNCPYFPNILEALSTVTCVSDYEFFVRPIGPQVDTSPLPSLFGKSNTDSIKTEYEVAFASAAHNFLGAPAVGDLVHATGRWIIDCGHTSFKSELHPLFSFAKMKTVVSETNTFTGLEVDLFGGKPATRVAIWINGWFPGGDNNAIAFDAFPPPRPSPDAVLHVVKPVDFGPGNYTAAEDVTLTFTLAPLGTAGHVHLRFTSPRRENVVTGAGEMMFESGRQYWGIWYLYWGQ